MNWRPAWLRGYGADQALQDGIAGLVVTALLVPQSLAYAMLAGLPPHIGLYASVLPILAYAAFGSSMTLAVGPAAIASLMTASAVAPLAVAGSPEYLILAMLLALLGGIQLIILGLLRMGFVASLLSHPVISGFVTGSALLIALGQMKSLLGIPAHGETALQLAFSLLDNARSWHPVTALLGAAAVGLLLSARRFLAPALRRAGLQPSAADLIAKLSPMGVVGLGIAVVALAGLDVRHGVAVVGAIPRGLPSLHVVWPTLAQVAALSLPAFMIALVGYVESIAVAQSLAIKRREHVDPDAEMRGLGAASVASALSGGFPVTGGFSRSAVNFAAGARTPMAGIVSAGMIALVLVGFAGLFERLPLAVLAATIIVAVLGLVDLGTPRRAWRYDRADALAWLGTAVGVLAFGVEWGVAIGVVWSVGTFLFRASRPHVAVLGRVPGTEHFRNELRAAVESEPGLLVIRVDENLFFANIDAVVRRILLELAQRARTRNLVLVFSSVSHVDLTAVESLHRLHAELAGRGVALHLAEVKGPVLDRFRQGEALGELARAPFISVHAAVSALGAQPPIAHPDSGVPP